MKIKWNWGTKLVIVIILFMSFIFFMIYKTSQEDFYLVTDDYYPKGLEYQNQIDKMKNYKQLDDEITYEILEGLLNLQFPSQFNDTGTEGNINIYCADDPDFDKNIQIELKNNQQILDITNLKKGKYTLKIDWIADDTKYYHEIKILK